ncbi:MAG: A/G-specific adenine glycosylase [Pedobacter sp.]|nr:MAG: A/G-specific adenine glycosylase [Pedobacter sp.]
MSFQKEIIKWYKVYKRALPWRQTTDAYVIWLSEIILQQTRVEQGLPYFERFVETFPTVGDFASADEDQVLKLWQGLGYYSRGRNMLLTAKQVMAEYNGKFPTSYVELIKLKGIGDYTAAAISSFSVNENRAVLDGNVFRVLSRYFGVNEDIGSPSGKRTFSILAHQLIENENASIYNQAIMEFGALQCKPKSPNCGNCPLISGCYAYRNSQVDRLPVKIKRVKVKERWLNYFVGFKYGYILMKQRHAGDVWNKLYDFPQIETFAPPDTNNSDFLDQVKSYFGEEVIIRPIDKKKHLLTHQIIYVQFFVLENYMINFNLHTEIKSVLLSDFKALPHPKVISDFLDMHFRN